MHTRIHPNTRTKVHTHIHTQTGRHTRDSVLSLFCSRSLSMYQLFLYFLSSSYSPTSHSVSIIMKQTFVTHKSFLSSIFHVGASLDLWLRYIFLQLTWVAFVIVTFYLHFLREVLHPNAISLQSYTKGPWTLDGWMERLDQTTDLKPTSMYKLLVELNSVTFGPLKLLHKKNGRSGNSKQTKVVPKQLKT